MKENISEIVLATTNRGKLAELREMLSGTEIRVRGLDDFDELPPAVEDGDTFAENARRKALYYSQLLKKLVLADDSGLQVDALDGAPGIYSARFAQVDAQDRMEQDRANIEKLLVLLRDIPQEERTCRFCCCLCLSRPEEILLEVEDFVEGVITDMPRGSNGFGYDPIFYLPDRGKTIAQLPSEEKNVISHRGRALRKLIVQMQQLSNET
jgi:XTP/dITP diphosphohydrolase